jgi:hypothetical protein
VQGIRKKLHVLPGKQTNEFSPELLCSLDAHDFTRVSQPSVQEMNS